MRPYALIFLLLIPVMACAPARTAKECNTLGMQAKEAGEHEKAIKLLNCAVKKEPGNYEYINNLGRVYFNAEDYDSAADAFKRAADLSPGNTAILLNLGAALANMKDYEGSAKAYMKAIEINPLEVRAYYELGIVYAIAGAKDKAYTMYNRLNELIPGQAERLLRAIQGH